MPPKKISITWENRTGITLDNAREIVPKDVFSDLEFLAGLEVLPLTESAKCKSDPYRDFDLRGIICHRNKEDKNRFSYSITDLSHPVSSEHPYIREVIGRFSYTSLQIQELREEDDLLKNAR
jgi:hypothetical protein